MPHGKLVVEIEREDYSRWIAEVVAPPGVMAYGSMRDVALARVEIQPRVNASGAVKAVLGHLFRYVEAGVFDGSVYRFELLPPEGVPADRAREEPPAAPATRSRPSLHAVPVPAARSP
jgi:hypothetical protein